MGKSRQSATGGGGQNGDENEGNGVEGQLFTDEEWDNVNTPEEIAEMIGWDADVTRNKSGKITSVKFHDPVTGMNVEFNNLTSSNAKLLFDMENKGRDAPINETTTLIKNAGLELERRNFKDVVRIVQELTPDQKYANPLIVFKNDILSAPAYGTHSYYNDPAAGHMTIIYGISFIKNSHKSGHSLERTIDHETWHGVDYMSSTHKNNEMLSGSGLSSNKKFVDVIEKRGYGVNAITENVGAYSPSKHSDFDMRFRTESFADAKSIISMRNKGHGNEYVSLGNGESVTVNEWCDRHSDVVDVVEGLSASPSEYGVNKNYNKPTLYFLR